MPELHLFDDRASGARVMTRKLVDRVGYGTLSSDAARDELRLVVIGSDVIPASAQAVLDAVAAIAV